MNYNIQDYPQHLKVESAVKKFKNDGWPVYTETDDVKIFVDNITKKITNELGFFPNPLLLLKPTNFNFGIFRAREVDSFSNINVFSEHSYPPPKFTKLGRCNFPLNPVFYSSNSPITAVSEIIRENDFKGKKICISSWKIIDSNQQFVFEHFLHTPLHPRNSFELLAKMTIDRIDEAFENKLDNSRRKGIIELLEYFDNEFIKDDNYSFSASLAHRRIYANHNYCTDILMYPSLQSNLQGVNLAINPNFVDNHMKIERLYIVEPISYDRKKGKIVINVNKYGDILKNTIFWRKFDLDDEICKKYFEEDFKQFLNPNDKMKLTIKNNSQEKL